MLLSTFVNYWIEIFAPPFLPVSIRDWCLPLDSRPRDICGRQCLPCYVPAKTISCNKLVIVWILILLLISYMEVLQMYHHVINAIVEHDCHPVAGSFRGRPRFFMRGTSSSPSPEVSSRCSTSLLPRASSISFFSSVAFGTRIQNSRKIQVQVWSRS